MSLASSVSSAGHDHLLQGGDRLGVVALLGAIAGVQEAAVGVGDVGGRLGVGRLLRPPLERARLGALGLGCRGVGGDPLLVCLLPGGGLGLQLGLGLPQAGQPIGLAGKGFGQLVAAGIAEQPILALVGLGRLAQDLGDLFFELVVGAVGLVGGIAGQLGAIQRHRADADHAGGGAQLQGLDEEPGQRLLVAGTKAGDGHVVGGLVGGQHPEGDVLGQAAFDLAGGLNPKTVAIQQHPEQQLGVVGGMAVPVIPVRLVEGCEVELVDHVEDEPGEMLLGEPVAQVGGQQEGLVAVAAQKVVGHNPFYASATLTPNILILILRCQLLPDRAAPQPITQRLSARPRAATAGEVCCYGRMEGAVVGPRGRRCQSASIAWTSPSLPRHLHRMRCLQHPLEDPAAVGVDSNDPGVLVVEGHIESARVRVQRPRRAGWRLAYPQHGRAVAFPVGRKPVDHGRDAAGHPEVLAGIQPHHQRRTPRGQDRLAAHAEGSMAEDHRRARTHRRAAATPAVQHPPSCGHVDAKTAEPHLPPARRHHAPTCHGYQPLMRLVPAAPGKAEHRQHRERCSPPPAHPASSRYRRDPHRSDVSRLPSVPCDDRLPRPARHRGRVWLARASQRPGHVTVHAIVGIVTTAASPDQPTRVSATAC
jgi:hypothetical protein